jgi:thioredoxin-related protein
MQRNAGYRAKLVFLQLDSTPAAPGAANASNRLRDFSGREVTHAEIFKRYGVRLTPTVMLLGPGGETLAEPLAGFTGSDFYGAYLDERIETAVAKIKSRARGG